MGRLRTAIPLRTRRLISFAVVVLLSTSAAGLLSACVGTTGSVSAKNILICGQSLGPKKVMLATFPPGSPRVRVSVPLRSLTRSQLVHTWPTYFAPGPPIVVRFSANCSSGVNLGQTVGVQIVSRAFSTHSKRDVVAVRVRLLVERKGGTDSITFRRRTGDGIFDETLRVPVVLTLP